MGLATCRPLSRPRTPPRGKLAIAEVSPTTNVVASPSVCEFLKVFRLKFKLLPCTKINSAYQFFFYPLFAF
jgi:hypothetical protein